MEKNQRLQDSETYPRPHFKRNLWMSLNGTWNFVFDDNKIGEKERWFQKELQTNVTIRVPYCYQSKMSTIEDTAAHECMWYQRTFKLSDEYEEKRVLLNFGAVDYEAKVWINGFFAGMHRGGNCAFTLDITDYIFINEINQITVRAEDRMECTQPRGKQFWGPEAERIWYTPTSGIWQNVWLEGAGMFYLTKALITPDIDNKNAKAELHINENSGKLSLSLNISVYYHGKRVKELESSLTNRISYVTIDLQEEDFVDEIHYWSPDSPNLYEVTFLLKQGMIELDRVESYFGMRKISIKGKQILLNNKPFYQKLVLDQGYWPHTLMTPPDDAAIRYDIQMVKDMGFNGVRKHQKIEDPRFYYEADRMGIVVWGEMPSAYYFNTQEMENIISEWMEFLNQAYNHPSIITWVPLNESWGVRNIVNDSQQQFFAKTLYDLTKSFDKIRLISSNDGWEQVEDSDICGLHDYTAKGANFEEKFSDIQKVMKGAAEHRMAFANGQEYHEKPLLITEYGGIAFESDNKKEWGYYGAVKDKTEFLERFGDITEAIKRNRNIVGYCYTQLTDVLQEVNGLMTEDRRLKVELESLRKINS